MADIRIDTDGLERNISDMNGYISELESLINRTITLLSAIKSGWEGKACEAYIMTMQTRVQKAQQMIKVLQEFKSYMENAKQTFIEQDQTSASQIRGC